MAGSIRRRGKDGWGLTIDLGRDAQGRRLRRFLTVRGTKKEAERVLSEALHQRDTGIDIAPNKITVGDFLERWLRDYATEQVAASTLQRYQGIVRLHPDPGAGAGQAAGPAARPHTGGLFVLSTPRRAGRIPERQDG